MPGIIKSGRWPAPSAWRASEQGKGGRGFLRVTQRKIGRPSNDDLNNKLLGFSQGRTRHMDHESLWPSSCWHQNSFWNTVLGSIKNSTLIN